jgi:hypothetical protein
LGFNPEAEKFFGKKNEVAINQNYIRLFIPKPVREKTEKEMNKRLGEALDGKLKMQVIVADATMPVIEWSVNILLNNQKIPTGMILIKK